jgi:two-component system, chemotaxis family, sensor kinase CheA
VDKDQLVKRLMATFREELAEHVGALNRHLLALEKEADDSQRAELLQTLFRTAHSLKGAARSVSLSLIERTCHQLEEILTEAREGTIVLGPDHFALLFATADAFEEAGMRLREQQDLSNSPLAAVLPRLEAAAGGRPVPLPPSAPAPDTGGTLRRPGPTEPRATERAAAAAPLLESVPPATEPLRAPPAEARPPTAEEPPASGLPPSPDGGTVRVAAEKLDAFLARDGELLVARRRIQSRLEEVTALREFGADWTAEWRAGEKALRQWLKKTSAASSAPTARPEAIRTLDARLPRAVAAALARAGTNLRQLDKTLDRLAANMSADHRQLRQAADALDDELRRVRMIPFADACQGLERMVRDLAQAGGKEVALVVEGGTVELDRSILEGLKDPLRHLVRNAVDHGAEPPAERRAAGKPAQVRITVAAVLRGSQVEVQVADDGRGIDRDALRQTLRRKGLPAAADEQELLAALFLPGVSTSRLITDVSGRGVGLDVVKSRVEALHGTVRVTSVPGNGARFTLAVPLTLTTLRALLVEAGGQTFALAGMNVERLIHLGPDDLVSVAGREMLAQATGPLPVATLAETLGLHGREAIRPAGKRPAVIVAAAEKRMAFVVDELLAEQEIMIKNLGPRVRRLRRVSGATILPSGRIALVLNAASLIRSALGRAPAGSIAAVPGSAPAVKKRILVAEDSLTTRTLEKSILEAAGYEALLAADGDVAWQLLQERGADLLVSDVEMPRLDGFALAESVRASPRFRTLPIVLVTARGTERDKARGAEVGADAYLVKSAFDQTNLLETIAQLL